MDLAGRAHQPPGRLVDEDALRGLPLAQRTWQGQSGVAFLVGELVHLQEPLLCRRREDGLRLAYQVHDWSFHNSTERLYCLVRAGLSPYIAPVPLISAELVIV